MYKNNKMKCINCGQIGHSYKSCREPKISYGILALSVGNKKNIKNITAKYLRNATVIPDKRDITYNNNLCLEKFPILKERVKVLLIMRKHTLGYTEFIRGHYRVDNISGISYFFEQMTPDEIKLISDNLNNFDVLWKYACPWSTCGSTGMTIPDSTQQEKIISDVSNNSEHSESQSMKWHNEHIEYDTSKANFIKLRDVSTIRLSTIIKNTKSTYDCPEWGVPKGRRAVNETDLECAIREFSEETGYTRSDYELFDGIPPLIENITGSNGIKYRHVYYIALLGKIQKPSCDNLKKTQLSEIGDIGLFNLDDAWKKIRPHHTERKKIICSLCANIIENIICNLN